jgi:hypothetical protein
MIGEDYFIVSSSLQNIRELCIVVFFCTDITS